MEHVVKAAGKVADSHHQLHHHAAQTTAEHHPHRRRHTDPAGTQPQTLPEPQR